MIEKWDESSIRSGFVEFYSIHGRYPSAEEVDAFPGLPSSRQIQRAFGGLVALRQRLFPDAVANMTTGAHRSAKASEIYGNARIYEERFYRRLTNLLEEISVHEQKRLRPGNVASDFFIYLNESSGICIDVFYSQNMRSVQNVINIKLKRYRLVDCPVYLVVVEGGDVDQDRINAQITRRDITLPDHLSVFSEKYFWDTIAVGICEKSLYTRK